MLISEFMSKELNPLLQGVDFGALETEMSQSDATAKELVVSECGRFGADLIQFPAGGKVPLHSHSGSHILIVIGGNGRLLLNEESASLRPGVVYLVPESVEHEIQAGASGLSLVSVGNFRFPPGSIDRLTLIKTR